jgi:hypothetical protein
MSGSPSGDIVDEETLALPALFPLPLDFGPDPRRTANGCGPERRYIVIHNVKEPDESARAATRREGELLADSEDLRQRSGNIGGGFDEATPSLRSVSSAAVT